MAVFGYVRVSTDMQAEDGQSLAVQQRQRPFDLRRPNKSNRSRGPRQLPPADQLLQRSRYFQNGHATAGVVIGSGPLVVKMATESDLFLFQFGIGAGNGGCNHFVIRCMITGTHHRVQTDMLSARQALPQCACGF